MAPLFLTKKDLLRVETPSYDVTTDAFKTHDTELVTDIFKEDDASSTLKAEYTEATEIVLTTVLPCAYVSCQNGGNCVVEAASFLCKCPEPFHGSLCELHPCDGVDCENKGICISESAVFGNVCEHHPCDGINCQNGGTCDDQNEVGKCNCPEPFLGDLCDKHPCDDLECGDHGDCNVESGNAQCSCHEPYTGDKCQTHPCDLITCQNGGNCIVVNGNGQCSCSGSFSGIFCQCPPNFVRPAESLNWQSAKTYCTQIGGFLAFFRDENEFSIFKNARHDNNEEWIGYHQKYPNNNDIYETVDGEEAIFFNWDKSSGEPSSADEQCVKIKPAEQFVMHDSGCNALRKFTCMKSQNC
ncbi:Oidioi.mRNA.OKI2018_I69.PAR.g9191.t1.cds [Oikopleura dioica]|uniref:Oidioi.mRNA.OKI2018_I69.PAR.g9191.t1.cds n=1 Tax=Oikopleura dioica TaxID=34765 RepID=A0ABN7RNH9_OIKDI|nr:Oidioi.mRNA.OKI2018_I69.PAR.g9191.t1.cds [Oikopleura dioica]